MRLSVFSLNLVTRVEVSPESDGNWKRTGASLVVGVVGHHVSPVEVS